MPAGCWHCMRRGSKIYTDNERTCSEKFALLNSIMKKRWLYGLGAAAVAAIVVLQFFIRESEEANRPRVIDSERRESVSAKDGAIRSLENPLPSADESALSDSEKKRLAAARKHLPHAPEADLRKLAKSDVLIENIERPRSPTAGDFSMLKAVVKDFYKYLGVFPEGDNAAVIKALRGDNAKKMIFLSVTKGQLNLAGEMIDTHGTPYQINVTSEGKISLRSAGADRLFGTTDDAVSKP
jgi:hypothetical protein